MGYTIPNNYFFYWTGQDFQYVNYLCIASLLKTNKVEKCEIYYEEAPIKNDYWDSLKKINKIRLVKLDYDELFREARIKKENFDDFFLKATTNHKTDLFRYLILYCYGGLYLDFDTISIKDFEPLLRTEFFIAFQLYHDHGKDKMNGAVMGSVERSPIIKMCLDRVMVIPKTKEKFDWATVGPEMLTQLLYPKSYFSKIIIKILEYLDRFHLNNIRLVTLLNRLIRTRKLNYQIYPKSFFYLYYSKEWKKLFQQNSLPRDVFLLHLWNARSNKFTKKIDEAYIKNDDSLYACIAKKTAR